MHQSPFRIVGIQIEIKYLHLWANYSPLSSLGSTTLVALTFNDKNSLCIESIQNGLSVYAHACVLRRILS